MAVWGGIQDLGEPAVTELLLDWLDLFLTVEEQDRLLGWHLGVSLKNPVITTAFGLCDQDHRHL